MVKRLQFFVDDPVIFMVDDRAFLYVQAAEVFHIGQIDNDRVFVHLFYDSSHTAFKFDNVPNRSFPQFTSLPTLIYN